MSININDIRICVRTILMSINIDSTMVHAKTIPIDIIYLLTQLNQMSININDTHICVRTILMYVTTR